MDVREKKASKKRLIDYYYLAEKIECPGVPLVYWDDIEAAPIVDAVEVVHGRWIEKWGSYDKGFYISRKVWYECSHCGMKTNYRDECFEKEVDYNYCPNCGAKMDGGED